MYRKVEDEAVTRKFEAKWGARSSPSAGYDPGDVRPRDRETLKAMYVFGEDIAQTDPNVHHVEHALDSLDLLVVHDIFENVTAKFAHVILPGSWFLEKTGTFTNAERRVQIVEAGNDRRGGQRTSTSSTTLEGARLRHALPRPPPTSWTRSPS